MRRYTVEVGGKQYVIDVQEVAADRFRVMVAGQEFEVHLSGDEDVAEATITPEIVPVRSVVAPAPYHPPAPETLPSVHASSQPVLTQPRLSPNGARGEMTAPMPGTILTVMVAPGERVAFGQVLLTLEAMKMKNAIKSPQEGVVAEILVQPGQIVGHGDVLLRFA